MEEVDLTPCLTEKDALDTSSPMLPIGDTIEPLVAEAFVPLSPESGQQLGGVVLGGLGAGGKLVRPPRHQPMRMSDILGSEEMERIREESRQARADAVASTPRIPERVRRARFSYYLHR